MLVFGWIVVLVSTLFVTFAAIIFPVIETKFSGRVSKETKLFVIGAIAMWITVYIHFPFTITVNT